MNISPFGMSTMSVCQPGATAVANSSHEWRNPIYRSASWAGRPDVKAYGGTVAPVAGVTTGHSPIASSAHRAHLTTPSIAP
jgi:hypothetical protein